MSVATINFLFSHETQLRYLKCTKKEKDRQIQIDRQRQRQIEREEGWEKEREGEREHNRHSDYSYSQLDEIHNHRHGVCMRVCIRTLDESWLQVVPGKSILFGCICEYVSCLNAPRNTQPLKPTHDHDIARSKHYLVLRICIHWLWMDIVGL